MTKLPSPRDSGLRHQKATVSWARRRSASTGADPAAMSQKRWCASTIFLNISGLALLLKNDFYSFLDGVESKNVDSKLALVITNFLLRNILQRLIFGGFEDLATWHLKSC